MTGIPTYDELLWPTIEALRSLGGSASISELEDRVIADEGFTEGQQSILHKDGPRSEISYRLGWARTYVKGMGLAENGGRGIWALTERGRQVGKNEIDSLRREFAKRRRTQAKVSRSGSATDSDPDQPQWQDQLLESLLAMPPDGFERLCQRLLREAGFSRTQVTGRTGDGGIDGLGVYRLSLVSFQVFFQAKRWRNNVGAKEVRDFRGAMAGRGEKGLLITTASFTADAKLEAGRDGAPPVDLVDGAQLCELLAQYEIGVRTTRRTVTDAKIDEPALKAM